MNDETRYGAVAVLLHWLVAAAVFTLFPLGLWMTSLTYYDPWYQLGPWWHKGIGVMLFGTVALRLAWRAVSRQPEPLPGQPHWARNVARWVHGGLYLLLLAVMASGYLISTADGRPLEVFGWFAVPATVSGHEDQADIAGAVHLALAITLLGLVLVHAVAALKHHFIDRDRTLVRMLGR